MKKSLYSLFAVLAIFCACQDENSQLGKSLVESSFYNVYADTCSVDISTILLDSIETRGDSICQLGHYRSSAWGEVSATYYAEYSTSDFTPNTDYTYTLDSLVLRMIPSGHFWGDTLTQQRKYSINSLVYWVTYVHNVVYSFYRSMIYCYINSTQRCAGSIVIDIIPTNGADKRKFFPFAPYFPVTNVIKRYFYPYFPAIIGIKGYSFPYFPYLSGIMKIKTALYSLFSRLDWHKTVVFPCLGEIYEGIRSLSWEIPVT